MDRRVYAFSISGTLKSACDGLQPALNNVLSSIDKDVKTLTLPAAGQSKSQATTELMNLAAFQSIKNSPRTLWGLNYEISYTDHDPEGAAESAERVVINNPQIEFTNIGIFHIDNIILIDIDYSL